MCGISDLEGAWKINQCIHPLFSKGEACAWVWGVSEVPRVTEGLGKVRKPVRFRAVNFPQLPSAGPLSGVLSRLDCWGDCDPGSSTGAGASHCFLEGETGLLSLGEGGNG